MKPTLVASLMAKRFGLWLNEAESFSQMTEEQLNTFEDRIYQWKLENGFPNERNSLVRDAVLNLLKGKEP